MISLWQTSRWNQKKYYFSTEDIDSPGIENIGISASNVRVAGVLDVFFQPLYDEMYQEDEGVKGEEVRAERENEGDEGEEVRAERENEGDEGEEVRAERKGIDQSRHEELVESIEIIALVAFSHDVLKGRLRFNIEEFMDYLADSYEHTECFSTEKEILSARQIFDHFQLLDEL